MQKRAVVDADFGDRQVKIDRPGWTETRSAESYPSISLSFNILQIRVDTDLPGGLHERKKKKNLTSLLRH